MSAKAWHDAWTQMVPRRVCCLSPYRTGMPLTALKAGGPCCGLDTHKAVVKAESDPETHLAPR